MIMVAYDYIWFLESTKERKKNAKENGFLIFGFTMKNSKKKKQILIIFGLCILNLFDFI